VLEEANVSDGPPVEHSIMKRAWPYALALAIVVTGSPDMGSPPRIPHLLRGLASRRTEAINRMFLTVAAEEHLTFAPIAEVTGPLFRTDRSLFAEDRFHPNSRGYATWIHVLNEAIARAITGR